jgi:hypothetical protein
MAPKQPRDEWEFLPDDESEEGTPSTARAAEVAAIHIEAAVKPSPPDPEVQRAARAARAAQPRAFYFADEQPEGSRPRPDTDDDPTELTEMLESQHYRFEEHPPR